MERKNGVHQDRLVKKFRRKNISSYQAANVYLQAEYLPALNQRFAQNPARPEDYHRAKPSAAELDAVFRLETERWVSNDWVVRYNGRYLQLLPPRCCDGPRVKAQVYESPNGTLEVCYRGQPVAWEEILGPPAAQETPGTVHVPHSRPRRKPSREHPYRQGYRNRIRLIREKLLQRGSATHPAGGASASPAGSAPAPPAPSPSHPTEGTLLSS